LFGICDLHLGNPFCSLPHFLELRDYIATTPNAYAICIGDLIEANLLDSKGSAWDQIITPSKQKRAVIEILKPIKHKILGMTSGNHEARIYRNTSTDVSEEMATELGVPYFPDGIYLKVTFGSSNYSLPDRGYSFWVYGTHGWGGARRIGSKVVKVEDLGDAVHADVYLIAHDHTTHTHPQNYLVPDNRTYAVDGKPWKVGLARNHRKNFVGCGAWVKWGGYAQRGGHQPTDLGTSKIILHGLHHGRRDVEVCSKGNVWGKKRS
jgi:hypothetical protein